MEVYLIAEPQIDRSQLRMYLDSIGADKWSSTNAQSDSELLVEVAGRSCYRSWQPGLNLNVTKVREGNDHYLANIIKSGHGSVLEHAQATWIFANVSRVFTHELVRHRVGTAISQESLRYVRLQELEVRIPDCLSPIEARCISMVEALSEFQKYAANALDLDGMPFAEKKVVTSALRRLAPIGLSTTMVWSCNMRTLRHVIEMRTSKHAEEEINTVFRKVAVISVRRWPALFDDYSVNNFGEWTTDHRKI